MKYVDYVKDIYYNLYINNNLKNALKCLNFQWIDPKDIGNNPNITAEYNNCYLKENDYSKLLVKDILENGTYWPYIVYDQHHVCEGCHRIKSIKENYGTVWPKGKKVFCILQDSQLREVRTYIASNLKDNGIPSDPNVKFMFDNLKLETPVYMWVSDKKMYWEYLKEKIKYSKDIYDTPLGKFYLIEIDNKAHLIDSLIYMSIKLREDLFLYHNKNNMIYTCDELNNEDAFYKWKNSNFEKIIHCKKNNYEKECIYVNDIKINNVILYTNKNNNFRILCNLKSNLLDTLNFDITDDNIVRLNNDIFIIKQINISSTSHSDDLGAFQILNFNY